MMRVRLLAVGRLKEPFYAMACAEYEKRLSRFLRLECVAVDDEREPAAPSEALNRRAMAREGERLLKHIAPDDHVIALCIGGASPDSESFAARLSALSASGKRVAFVIGGSLGLDDAVVARADEKLSLSRMTFPHQLARVVLLEQLYRAQKILAGERYHK